MVTPQHVSLCSSAVGIDNDLPKQNNDLGFLPEVLNDLMNDAECQEVASALTQALKVEAQTFSMLQYSLCPVCCTWVKGEL